MLTMTERAVSTIRQLTEDPRVPDGAGLRITAADTDGNLAVALVESPGQGDQVVTYGDGTAVFLDEQAAMQLDDKVMDADIGPEGQVSFILADQMPQ